MRFRKNEIRTDEKWLEVHSLVNFTLTDGPGRDKSLRMDKQTLEAQIDLAAARYAHSKEPVVRYQIEQLAHRLAEFKHLATVENALARSRSENMRTPEVVRALYELGKILTDQWPIEQISRALNNNKEDHVWQLANAALNALRVYVTR